MNHDDDVEVSETKYMAALIVCPHCSGKISLKVDLRADEAVFASAAPRARSERFSTSQVALLEKIDELGLMVPFTNVTRVVRNEQVPRDMDKFLLGWLRRASVCTTPRESLNILIAEYPGTRIKVYGSEGILMVTADGVPVLFVPEMYVQQSKHQQQHKTKHIFEVSPSEAELRQWIRTRNGYVSSRGYLWEELQKRSKGGFAVPSL